MKLYDKYQELKKQDSTKMYLFKNGNFYIFLAEDADLINKYMVLKKTQFSKDIMKCGFPVNSIDAYLKVFQNHNFKVEVIDKFSNPSILDKIKHINLDNISPIEALNLLYEIQKEIL